MFQDFQKFQKKKNPLSNRFLKTNLKIHLFQKFDYSKVSLCFCPSKKFFLEETLLENLYREIRVNFAISNSKNRVYRINLCIGNSATQIVSISLQRRQLNKRGRSLGGVCTGCRKCEDRSQRRNRYCFQIEMIVARGSRMARLSGEQWGRRFSPLFTRGWDGEYTPPPRGDFIASFPSQEIKGK